MTGISCARKPLGAYGLGPSFGDSCLETFRRRRETKRSFHRGSRERRSISSVRNTFVSPRRHSESQKKKLFEPCYGSVLQNWQHGRTVLTTRKSIYRKKKIKKKNEQTIYNVVKKLEFDSLKKTLFYKFNFKRVSTDVSEYFVKKRQKNIRVLFQLKKQEILKKTLRNVNENDVKLNTVLLLCYTFLKYSFI